MAPKQPATEAQVTAVARQWFRANKQPDNRVNGKTEDEFVASVVTAWRSRRVEHVTFGDDEVDVVKASTKSDFQDNLFQQLSTVSTRVVALAGMNGVAVLRACQAFKSEYALAKLDQLEGTLTGEELVKLLVGAVAGKIGEWLTAGLTGAGAFVAKTVADGLKDKVSDAARQAAGSGAAVKDLKHAVEQFATAVQDIQSVAEERANDSVKQRIEPILEKLRKREPLSDDDDALAGPFYQALPTEIDEVIEQVFGLLGAAKSKQLELDIFEELVEKFEYAYLMQTTSGMGRFVGTAGEGTPAGGAFRQQARAAAEQARGKRQARR